MSSRDFCWKHTHTYTHITCSHPENLFSAKNFSDLPKCQKVSRRRWDRRRAGPRAPGSGVRPGRAEWEECRAGLYKIKEALSQFVWRCLTRRHLLPDLSSPVSKCFSPSDISSKNIWSRWWLSFSRKNKKKTKKQLNPLSAKVTKLRQATLLNKTGCI